MSNSQALDAKLDRLTARAIETDKAIIDMLTANNHALRHEVVELRELVRDMWEFGFGCNSGANDAWAWHERTDELEDRMRELGVEVEG